MDNNTLRKVQLAQLEIAKEIKRVCDENDIKFLNRTLDLLDEDDDVQAVYHNWDE